MDYYGEISKLYNGFGRKLVCMAAARMPVEDAEDIVHTAFLKLLESGRKSLIFNKEGWLMTVVANLMVDRWRKRRELRFAVGLLEIIDRRRDVRADAYWKEFGRLIEEALDAIPETEAEIFRMRAIDGIPYEQISRDLKVCESTLMSRYSRARRNLRKQLGEYVK